MKIVFFMSMMFLSINIYAKRSAVGERKEPKCGEPCATCSGGIRKCEKIFTSSGRLKDKSLRLEKNKEITNIYGYLEARDQILRMTITIPGHLLKRVPNVNTGWATIGLNQVHTTPFDLQNILKYTGSF